MPSASLQSRINAFEALTISPPSLSSTGTTSKHGKYPPLSPHPLDSPISPTYSSFYPIAPFTPPKPVSRSPSPSPPNLGRKTSLIDLKDWVVDDGPCQSTQKSNGRQVNGNRSYLPRSEPTESPIMTNPSMPLINFESPPKLKTQRPPLPPRKPSYASAESAPSRSVSTSNDNGATLRPPGCSDSLTIEHTYPPTKPNVFGAARLGHAPASSVSSFHSVSLSSDGGAVESTSPNGNVKSLPVPIDREGNVSLDADVVSLDESFENVSVTSATSPSNAHLIPLNWEKAISRPRLEPPKLPVRPGPKSLLVNFTSLSPGRAIPPPLSRSTSASSNVTTTTRRPPPPPPPSTQPHPPQSFRHPPSSTSLTSASASASTSDRSSILSTTTTTSRTSPSPKSTNFPGSKSSFFRHTPVPAAARGRYEAVFVASVLSRRKAERADAKKPKPVLLSRPNRKSRQAAGWRGLSVDLITNPEDHPILSEKDNAQSAVEEVPVGPEERLDGQIVKLIWSASKLDKEKLRNIWNESDPARSGSLDRDAFVQGMWRIDEELRRVQLSRRISSSSSNSLRKPRPPPRTTKLVPE